MQKKYDLWRYQNERVEARRLQRSAVDHDLQVVMSETTGKAKRGEDGWILETEGETETLETQKFSNGVEGVPAYPIGEGRHGRRQVKKLHKAKRSARRRR